MPSETPHEFGWQFYAPRLLLPWSVLRGGGSPTYSGYMVEKTHIPRISSKFIMTKFRTNFRYMDFYKPIITVCGWTAAAQNAPWKQEPALVSIPFSGFRGFVALLSPRLHFSSGSSQTVSRELFAICWWHYRQRERDLHLVWHSADRSSFTAQLRREEQPRNAPKPLTVPSYNLDNCPFIC